MKGHGFHARDPKAVGTPELSQTEDDVVPLGCVVIYSLRGELWLQSFEGAQRIVAKALSLWKEREPQCSVGPPAGWAWVNWVSQDSNWAWALPRP